MTDRYAAFDLLQWLSKEAAAAVVNASRRRHVLARGMIYKQSDPGSEMFRLVSGSVRLSVMDVDGREVLYQLFGPGDCFGTSSMIDGEPRPQTAEAFNAVELQVLERTAVERLRHDFPEVNEALMKLLSRHMRLLSDYFAGAMLDELACRLAQRLVIAADTFGVESAEGVTLSRRLSQSELALMVGTARQTVNRMLKNFQNRGLISIRGGMMTITDLPKLTSMAHQGARLRDFAG